jgi:hypothetical protein
VLARLDHCVVGLGELLLYLLALLLEDLCALLALRLMFSALLPLD